MYRGVGRATMYVPRRGFDVGNPYTQIRRRPHPAEPAAAKPRRERAVQGFAAGRTGGSLLGCRCALTCAGSAWQAEAGSRGCGIAARDGPRAGATAATIPWCYRRCPGPSLAASLNRPLRIPYRRTIIAQQALVQLPQRGAVTVPAQAARCLLVALPTHAGVLA